MLRPVDHGRRRGRRRLRAVLSALVALLLCGVAVPAFAQGEVALAETLYQAGRELMAQGKYAEACPKFAESYRLDPATGTLLNLAACHEGEGKLASAWVEYTDAARMARRDGRASRVRHAEERAKELLPLLSRLTIALAPGVESGELEVTLDGTAVGPAAVGVAAPLDPGTHVVSARAPGKKLFTQTVVLGATADQQIITIPVLEPDDAAPAPPSAAAVAPAAAVPAAVAPAPVMPAPEKDNPPPASTGLPTSVWIAGGVTVALAATTVVTGVLYLDRRSDYEGSSDPAERQSKYDSAHALGVANAAFLAATLGGAALTGYFYFTTKKSPTGGAHVLPALGPSFAGVVAGSEF